MCECIYPPPPPQGWLRWEFLTPKWLLAGIPSGGVEPVGARGAKPLGLRGGLGGRSPPSIGGPGGGSPLVGVRGRSPRKNFEGVWSQKLLFTLKTRPPPPLPPPPPPPPAAPEPPFVSQFNIMAKGLVRWTCVAILLGK